MKLVLTKWSLKRLEPYDGKLSRTVLRGWKGWQRLFYYPTLNLLKISHWRCRLKIFNAHVALTTLRLKILSLLALTNFEQIWGRGLKISHWLVYLILILSSTNQALAFDEDQEWAGEVVKNAQSSTMECLKDKYIELQRMLSFLAPEGEEELVQELIASKPAMRVFVSSSMSRELLKSYVDEAQKYEAVLVFKGLPNGSWQELAGLISYIADDIDKTGIQIDDEAFERFEVSSVPAFVLSKERREFWQENKEEVFDKVTGNIGIKGALEMMAKNGDLADESILLLEGVK